MVHISIIIPFFNAERYIQHCLDGVLAQDVPHDEFEIIMIDNNSVDGSAQIVHEYPETTLLRESKQGAYAARNRGLSEAKGSIIVFTDPDCVPRSDWLRTITEPFVSHDVQLVVGKSVPRGQSPALKVLSDYETAKDDYVLHGHDTELYYGRTNNMGVRRQVFDQLGGFVERARGSDVILVHRCANRYGADSVRYLPDAEVRHLEIDNLATYFSKIFTYGRSSAAYSQVVSARTIPPSERLRIFRATCHRNRYSFIRRNLLLALMGIEGVSWRLGLWGARLFPNHTRRSET